MAQVDSDRETRASAQTRDKKLRSFRNLAIREAAAAISQLFIFFGLIQIQGSTANVAGMTLVIWLFVQGSAFWFAKYRQLSRQLTRLPGERAFFTLRWINPVLLGIGLLLIVATMRTMPLLHSWPGVVFWWFAFLEYIHYFHRQLTPDQAPRVRPPRRPRLSNNSPRGGSLSK